MPKWLLELMTGPAPTRTSPAPGRLPRGNGNNDEEDRIREALGHIPASLPHDDWVRVLMALHHWDPNRGKVLGKDWSSRCLEKFREPDFESAWRSFKPGGGVTLAAIFHGGVEQRSGERVRRLVNTEPNETATHRFFEDRL